MPSSEGLFDLIMRLTLNEQFTPSVHALEKQYRGRFVGFNPTTGQFHWKVLVVVSLSIPVLHTIPTCYFTTLIVNFSKYVMRVSSNEPPGFSFCD